MLNCTEIHLNVFIKIIQCTFNFVKVLKSVKKSKISCKLFLKSSDAPVGTLVIVSGNVGTMLPIAEHSGNIPPISLNQ